MGLKQRFLIQHYLRLGGAKRPPISPSTLKGLKQVCSINPSLKKFKGLESKIILRNPPSNHLGQQLGQLIKLKIDKKGLDPLV